MKRAKPAPVDKWQAEDDARTLARAHEIRSDKNRHSAAKQHIETLRKAIGSSRPLGGKKK